MKRPLVILIIFLILAILVIIFLRSRQSGYSSPADKTTTPSVAQPVVFPSAAASQPSYSVSIAPPSFPGSIPNYDTGGAAAGFVVKFKGLANLLGFSADPRIIVGSRGNFSLWNQGSSSLTLGGDPIETAYDSGLAAGGAVAQPLDSLDKTARAFIQKLGVIPTDIALVKESVDYFAPNASVLNSLPGPQGATLVQLNYRYLLNDRPLFVRRADSPSVSVKINASGQITSLSGYWFPGLTKKGGSIGLLDYQAASQKLINKTGVLTSLSSDADFNTESVFQYVVSQSAVTGVVLGYYYYPGNTTLTPVYVFSGSSVDDSTGKNVTTVTLVSALP